MRLGIVLAVLLPVLGGAEEPADVMTKGKIAADLGRHPEATAAFEAVAKDSRVPPAVRAEALIRLGSVRRAAGDHEGSVRAFERASKHPGLDRDTKALLVHALGGVVPGAGRWSEVWPKVTFVVDRSDPAQPGLAIRWPDSPAEAPRRYTGEPISLDVKDGDILDVMRLFSDISGKNVFVDPAVRGRVTIKMHEVPWDQALDVVVKTNGYRWQREGDIVFVHHGEKKLPPRKAYTGRPIALDLKNGDVQDLMPLFAELSSQNIVVFAPGEGYKVSLKIRDMPWDHVMDVILTMLGLQSRREGTVLWVSTGDFMPPLRTYSGKPIDVQLEGRLSQKEAIEHVVKLAGADVAIESGPAIPGLKHVPSYLNLKLKQVPSDQALDLVARVTLHELIADGDRLFVRPAGWTSAEPRTGSGLRRFRVREAKLLGVVNRKGDFLAMVQGLDGKAYLSRVGQKLHDGSIVAIDAERVTFEETQPDGTTRPVTKTIEPQADAPGAGSRSGDPASGGATEGPPAAGSPTAASGTVAGASTPSSVAARPTRLSPPPLRVDASVLESRYPDTVAPEEPGVVRPERANKVRIAMPTRAMAAKVSGTVLARVLVNEKGEPEKMELVRKIEHATGLECNDAALDAIRRMRWTPGTKDGAPVRVTLFVRIDFSSGRDTASVGSAPAN